MAESTDWTADARMGGDGGRVGLVRINLRGREQDGIVEPGREHEELLAEITRELWLHATPPRASRRSSQVERAADVVPGPRAGAMPDLFVRFNRDVVVRSIRAPARRRLGRGAPTAGGPPSTTRRAG